MATCHRCVELDQALAEANLRIEDLEWENKGIDEWRDVALQALAVVKRLKPDAERYQWLRDNARRIDFAGLSLGDMSQLDGRIDMEMR